MDGDIIVYQLEPPATAHYELPTANDYFKDLFYKVNINISRSGARLQGDWLNMALCFWCLVKSAILYVYSTVYWTIHFLQGARKTRPCLSGQIVSETMPVCTLLLKKT